MFTVLGVYMLLGLVLFLIMFWAGEIVPDIKLWAAAIAVFVWPLVIFSVGLLMFLEWIETPNPTRKEMRTMESKTVVVENCVIEDGTIKILPGQPCRIVNSVFISNTGRLSWWRRVLLRIALGKYYHKAMISIDAK